MVRLWQLHTQLEFATKDAAATVATMTQDNYVNHVSVMTGGRGQAELLEFYGKHFIPQMPADATLRLLARTVGQDRLVDEFIFSFTHDTEMAGCCRGSADTPKGRSSDGGRGAVPGR
jgi:carboxymethylenebutenolidase